jgi:hypothetical protein
MWKIVTPKENKILEDIINSLEYVKILIEKEIKNE